MGDYITITDIENRTGVSYSTSTSPTLNQMEYYISIAEARFESEVGVFTLQTFVDELVDGVSFGIWLKDYIPLLTITSVEENRGTLFDQDWKATDSDIYIDNSYIGKVLLSYPIIGHKHYRVAGTYGYSTIPLLIKNLVELYVWYEVFKNEFFDNKDANVTETINVDVYKEVTKGGSLSNGLSNLRDLIEKEKGNTTKQFKTYLL